MNDKPKIWRDVEIPEEVVESLKTVQQLIDEGEEVTTEPSDDLLQEGCLCGGLMDDGSGRFYFSVHLRDNVPYVWDIAVTPHEIKAIAEKKLTHIPLWCCTDPQCGFKTYLEHVGCYWCDSGGERHPWWY